MWKVANFVANTSCSKVFFSSSALALGVLVTYPAGPKGIAVRKVQWLTGQFITQFANYTAALPIRLRSGHTEWGVHGEGSSSIPGRALELWTPAHATDRLRSLYRLIPRQSSEAAAWALTCWKPIKYS